MRDAREATRRAIGAFLPPHSELRRRSDRIEVAARWVLLVVGVLLVPVALAVGSEVTARMEPQVVAQQADRHQVTGTVQGLPADDAPGAASGVWRAPVRWIAADGTARVADARVPATVRPGDTRSVWVDGRDRPTLAPLAPGQPAEQGVLTVALVLLTDLVLSLVLLAVLRRVLDRARLRAWEAAWRRFTDPDSESMR